MSIFTGLKLGIHKISLAILSTNFYGCLERYDYHFEPLRRWLIDSNKQYIAYKQCEHVCQFPELLADIDAAEHYLSANGSSKDAIEFSIDARWYGGQYTDEHALYSSWIFRIYNPNTWRYSRVSDDIGCFKIERSWHQYGLMILDVLTAHTPF